MQIFITGTSTNIGKTLVSAWICAHSNYEYFKPIQTGIDIDSQTIANLTNTKIHPEIYLLPDPLSPHLAAQKQNINIDINNIQLPQSSNLVIEGAGGILVPINSKCLMIDLVAKLQLPLIIVANLALGTINHSLLTIKAIKARNLNLLGIITTGHYDQDNSDAINHYGRVEILAHLPMLENVTKESLQEILLPNKLKRLLL